ncbi:lecithin retinol acyltransferase family protein [Cupriavidus pauculus]|uniref:Hydrolase n=1 Tax=Cupriavidus pauculus TaxID=82633 RepID=A0A2N5CBA3_9BURK|nr:lecithin retinol acyltransferase family protein [Cupriavidus pauculus]PLP99476.1 hydrolase [Cupriavidus pauculus]
MDTVHHDLLMAWPVLDGGPSTIEVGSHLVSERDGYTHHGIYVGNEQVIHYGGFDGGLKRRPVESISLRAFAAGAGVSIHAEPDAVYAGHAVVARARSRLGEDSYRLLTNNCEHFCAWCVSGAARSEQVRRCVRNPWTGIRMMTALLCGNLALWGREMCERSRQVTLRT